MLWVCFLNPDVHRAGLGEVPIQGVGGGPRAQGGGGLTPQIEAVAVDPGPELRSLQYSYLSLAHPWSQLPAVTTKSKAFLARRHF